MRKTDPDYPEAIFATVDILKECARQRRTIEYGELSDLLARRKFRISPHGDLMRYLLSDASTLNNEDGSRGMLSALVVTRDFGVPAVGFFEFAAQPPFSRTLRGDRLWLHERDRVWADHATAADADHVSAADADHAADA
ncbi:hypothetical protein [Streptacidiphilus sp. PAMC 29251]